MLSFDPIPFQPPDWALPHIAPQSIPTHRIPLSRLPTPIHRWHLPNIPDDVCEIYIKRDDLTGMQLSGNKIRKLEFILAEAKASGHDSIITLGGIQSNHARATAVAATYLGLEPHLILRTSRALVDQDPGMVGNLLVERLLGAHIHLVTKEEYTRVGQAGLGEGLADRLRLQGKNPYLIPVGGSSAVGTWGYMSMVEELSEQQQRGGLKEEQTNGALTDLVMACGSGGTTAGVALGNHLSGMGLRVTAYMVCDDVSYFTKYIDDVIFKQLLRDPTRIRAENLIRFVQAKGNGYAMSRPEELQTVVDVAAATGIILDPVYTGKAVHALIQEIKGNPEEWRGRKVLFVHTGGLLGLYDAAPQLQPLLPSHVERLVVQ